MVKQRGLIILTEGAPWKCILRFAFPLFIGSLLQQFYYTADAMMVGLLIGEEALSGVGTCGVVTNLLVAFSVGFSAGAGVLSAQHFGAGREQEIAKNAYATMSLLFVIGILIGGSGVLFGEPLLRYTVSVPESLMAYSGAYFRICAVGFLFQFLYNGVTALLRSIGDSIASLYFLLLSALLNVFLDYAWMQWGHMGVAGAAWATVFSQLLACAVSFVYMYRKYTVLRFVKRGIRLSFDDIQRVVRMGFPLAMQSMVGTVFNLMVQRLVNTFGEAMIASYTVVSRVEGYMHLPTSTLNQAIPTYTAQNVGAGKKERIRLGLRHTVAMSMAATLLMSLASFFFASHIAGLFGISGLSAEYCAEHIRWLSFPFLLFALYFPCTGLYQGMGRGMVFTAFSSSFLVVCLILAYALQYIPAIGYRALFICKPISWAIIASINYIYYFKGKWETPKNDFAAK